MGDKKNESFGDALNNLLETSSAHGLPNIHRSKSTFSKVAWTLLFFGSVSVLIIQVSSLFSTYLAHEYTVSLDVKFERSLNFPAITICNTNPVRKTSLEKANDGFRELFDVNFIPPGIKDPNGNVGAGFPLKNDQGEPSIPEVVASGDIKQPAAQPTQSAPAGQGTGSAGSAASTAATAASNTTAQSSAGTVSGSQAGQSGTGGQAGQGPPGPGTSGGGTQQAGQQAQSALTTANTGPGGVPATASSTTPNAVTQTGEDNVTESLTTTSNDEAQNSTSDGDLASTEDTIIDWGKRESGDFFKKRDDDYLKEERLISQLANLTEEERKDMGHSLEDMLLDCQWRGYPCSPSNFTSFYHYKYGNCFTFNSFQFGESLRTNRPGPLYGLTMELFLEQDEYMPEITESAGFRMVVHDRDTMPFPEDDGISISPGTKTDISVRVVTIERLDIPYGNCSDIDEEEAGGNIFKDRYGVSYSLKACERSCYQKEVINQCGCFDPHYPNSLENRVYPCDIDDDTAQTCMTDLEDEYKRGTLNCDCFQRCNETTYLTATSSSLWPADQFQAKLFRDINDKNRRIKEQLRGASPRDWVVKNVAKVGVFFEEFNYEYIKQSPAYTCWSNGHDAVEEIHKRLGEPTLVQATYPLQELDLASDIGGQLGLWLGLSLLTMFELFEQAGTFLAILFHKLCGGRRGSRNGGSSKVQKIRIFPTEDPGVAMVNY